MPSQGSTSVARPSSSSFSRSDTGASLHPAVTHPVDGLQRVECRFDVLELAPYTLHVRGDGVVIEYDVGGVHELLTVVYVPRMTRQRMDDPELGEREQHDLALPLGTHPLDVQCERPLADDVGFVARRLAQRIDPAEE